VHPVDDDQSTMIGDHQLRPVIRSPLSAASFRGCVYKKSRPPRSVPAAADTAVNRRQRPLHPRCSTQFAVIFIPSRPLFRAPISDLTRRVHVHDRRNSTACESSACGPPAVEPQSQLSATIIVVDKRWRGLTFAETAPSGGTRRWALIQKLHDEV
jgi:hypothetical protein